MTESLEIAAIFALSPRAGFWLAIIIGSWISLVSLHRALSVDASAELLDSIYKKDRDRSLDKERIRNVRISAASAFLFGLYFLYRTIVSWADGG